ncbi:DNA polymerase III, delta prime subunit [Paenibacillus curdlanolyticus YK9]|uniref:DNA polymerase III subunit delta' n=1 Tax=Paenibacillus curdlanolyticus YK9 TaxID=717606 RepID=E0I969_9BACL|nr:DNA polymerase III subunit delta' [Paenibacillus curdlanolyticus]EFM10953.1 DNA polymerase III, delta prime subunit [Paenibacillus curdlanolyticus YK9]
MSMDQVPGQEKAKGMLRYALRSGKVSHAYLFSGPRGTGRKALALSFAQALFCTAGGEDACGQCIECRKFEHGNQPDLYQIEPDGQSIKLGQIQQLQREMSYRNVGESRKVYIVERAETMTLPAANSLLKFLEEPQSPIVALLLTDNGQAVLPTIRSRVQTIPFAPLGPQQIVTALEAEGFPTALVRTASRLASGPEACRTLIQQNGFAETRNVVIQLGKESISRFTAAIVTVQQQVVKSEAGQDPQLLLAMLLLWFKDMIHYQAGRLEDMVFIDQSDWISKHAFARTPDGWVGCMEQVLECGRRIRAHVSTQLALEQLLVNLQEG